MNKGEFLLVDDIFCNQNKYAKYIVCLWQVIRPIIKQRRELGVQVCGGRVAILDGVVREGLNKKVILERSKRESYVDIWRRAVQKLGTTDTEAT